MEKSIWNKFLPLVCCLLLLLASCSEQDDTIEEFPNWPVTNDAYYTNLVTQAQAKKAAGDTTWDLFTSYSKPSTGYGYQPQDYVVIERLENATGIDLRSPALTDTVQVHYVGHLIPSADKYKTNGMEFDRSYSGVFNPEKATPAKFGVVSVVNGFSTALLHMHRGDHWRVYIPYQLGYGTTVRGGIPAGSTLIFDLRLVDFWRKQKGDLN